jgi:phosphatidylglycerophosphatase A
MRPPGVRWSSRIATSWGLGDRLPAPGTTAGSLPAALAWWLVAGCSTPTWLLHVATVAGTVLSTTVGLWAADVEASRRERSDPGPVVIDEVAGQWLTYLVALPVLPLDSLRQQAMVVAAGFLLFRVFDVVKPWPVRRLERLPGGAGIMADDLGAALYAGLALAVVARWLPL